MRLPVVVFLLLVFVVGSGWLAWSVVAGEGVAFAFPRDASAEKGGPVTLVEDGTGSGLPPPDAPGAAASAASAGDAAGVALAERPSTGFSVEVEVRPIARLLPPVRALELAVVRPAGPQQGELWPGAEAWVVAGPGTAFSAPSHGLSLVAFRIPGLPESHRLLRLPEPADGDGVARIPGPGAIGRLEGRVAGADGTPLEGASIWTGQGDPFDEANFVRTDAEGRFAVDVPGGPGVPFVVRAQRHAWSSRPLVVRPAATTRFDEALVEGATVTVVAIGRAAVGTPPVPGSLLLEPVAAGDPEIARYPFFLQALTGPAPDPEAGPVVLTGLPRGHTIGLRHRHPFRPDALRPHPVTPRQASVTESLPLRDPGPVRRGRVVDSQGRPVADAVVTVFTGVRPPGTVPNLGHPQYAVPPVPGASRTRAAADGTFAIGLPARRDAEGRDLGLRLIVASPERLGIEVEVVDWAGGRLPDLVLPGPAEVPTGAGPALELELALPDSAGASVQWRLAGRPGWTLRAADEAIVLPFREAALVDLVVRWEDLRARQGAPSRLADGAETVENIRRSVPVVGRSRLSIGPR